MINIDDFKKVEIRAGKILEATPVENSEKLLKLKVDFGEEKPRQVFSGIAKFIKPEELVGVVCGFVTNLEPRSIMGEISEAMIMAASGDLPAQAGDFFSLMRFKDDIPPGSVVR